MSEKLSITLYAEGPKGSGKTRALELIQDHFAIMGWQVGKIEECEQLDPDQLPCECLDLSWPF